MCADNCADVVDQLLIVNYFSLLLECDGILSYDVVSMDVQELQFLSTQFYTPIGPKVDCGLFMWIRHLYIVHKTLPILGQTTYHPFKVVLGGSPRCRDNHDLSKCHHLYDLGRHIEQP